MREIEFKETPKSLAVNPNRLIRRRELQGINIGHD
jgi:hypothetical protein